MHYPWLPSKSTDSFFMFRLSCDFVQNVFAQNHRMYVDKRWFSFKNPWIFMIIMDNACINQYYHTNLIKSVVFQANHPLSTYIRWFVNSSFWKNIQNHSMYVIFLSFPFLCFVLYFCDFVQNDFPKITVCTSLKDDFPSMIIIKIHGFLKENHPLSTYILWFWETHFSTKSQK